MSQTRYTLTGWNSNQLRLRVVAVFGQYIKAIDQQFKDEIKLVQWSWPRTTYRRNGTIEGSPRDIVDTGAFLGSQRRERPDPLTVRFTWGGGSVTYAGIILKGKGPSYPPRDWVALALRNLPLDRYFAEAWVRERQAGR